MYNKQEIENYLRNYTLLAGSSDQEFMAAKADLDIALKRMSHISVNLYKTILGVFVQGNPIQTQAKNMNVSKRQILRRLDDGLHMLTMIMNGELQ